MYPEPYLQTLLGQTDQRLLNNRPAKVILAVLLGTLLIVPSIQFCVKITQTQKSLFREGGERQSSALGRWLPTANLITQTPPPENPYEQGHWFPTPTFVLVCLAPLSKLSFLNAAIIWSILKIAGLLICLTLFVRAMAVLGAPVPVGVMLMAAIFSFRPIISDIQHGNLNIFMLVWLALAWVCHVRGRDFTAGVFLALAIVTKVTPALLLLYFLYKRRWRVCVGAVAGLILLVLIIPGLYLGFGRNIEFLQTWFNMLVRPYAVEGYASLEIANQSLYGTLMRILSNAGILQLQDMPLEEAYRAGMEDMARPMSGIGRLLRPAISMGVLAALAWICRGRAGRVGAPGAWLEFAAVLVAMLLLSERTWKHHATTLTLVYLVVWYALTMYPLSDRFRASFVVGLVAQLLLLVVGSDDLLGEELADRILDGGFFCWGLVLCGVQAAVLREKLRTRNISDQQSAQLAGQKGYA